MALNIKNPEVERLAHDLAEATGETLTNAVRGALQERLEQVRRRKTPSPNLLREVGQIQQAIADLPIRDARSPEQMLYDDHGLPR